jgi:hypothetical protein
MACPLGAGVKDVAAYTRCGGISQRPCAGASVFAIDFKARIKIFGMAGAALTAPREALYITQPFGSGGPAQAIRNRKSLRAKGDLGVRFTKTGP